MAFADVLDDAMYAHRFVLVRTKSRGDITGVPVNVDEYDSDPDRLGYCIAIGAHELDTVFLDEILEIRDGKSESVLAKAV